MPYVFASPFNVIYSAAKLKSDPTFPQRNVLGTGPFKFVEHLAGSSWKGARFENYFKPGIPYLDGFNALFLSSAALLNAIQSGRVMNEFRGLTTAQRDQLVHALGDKVEVFEKPWTSTNVVTFNSQRKPFDDPRVRRALSLAIDRWGASRSMPHVSIQAFVGGYLRPGYDLATREDDLVKMPGYSKDIEASRKEARQLLADAGQSNLKFKFHNRNLNDPNVTAAVYLIDQWRQIGVEVEHLPLNDTTWNANISAGDFDATFENQTDPVDEPDLQLARYQSYDISGNRSRYTDRKLDELYAKQKNASSSEDRYKYLAEFQERMLTEAYTVPFLWLDRIIVLPKTIHGWAMTSSPYVGQDLEQVWLST
jgi:peptide/nickel transport system substrate-binding protein